MARENDAHSHGVGRQSFDAGRCLLDLPWHRGWERSAARGRPRWGLGGARFAAGPGSAPFFLALAAAIVPLSDLHGIGRMRSFYGA
jgi:hypothetical protein